MLLLRDHARHLLLLQGLSEDQQQGLSCCFGGPEGEEQASGEGDRVPSEASGGSVLRAGHQEIQAQETGWFISLKLFRVISDHASFGYNAQTFCLI